MRTALICTFAILIVGTETHAGETKPQPPATTVLELREADHPHMIDVQVTVDGRPFDDYWSSVFDAIFDFADTDDSGVLNEQEIRLVPSARAVRLSLGNAFTPPVAAIQSLNEILTDPSQKCTKEQLRQYYLRHGAGRLLIGSGKLPHTAALTQALLQALDADKDQRLSQTELQRAETALRRLDTNDDELIGVGELVPNATYPGSWAANALQAGREVNLSPSDQPRLVLKRRNTQLTSNPDDKVIWQISIADRLTDQPLQVSTSQTRCLSWSIPGPINELFAQLREEIANADPEPPKLEKGERSRDRRPSRAWLTPLGDRNGNGILSQQEIDQWLNLQQQLIHGQLLVSIYSGGGLFELLDTNHDAALSIRELRNMWQNLESAACTSDSHVELQQVPQVVLFVVSQGYPDQLGRRTTTDVEWFRLMDRNRDGDVSRREFTGSPAAFDRLDQDHDSLISPREAARQD
ncbi:transaldolase/EF-hand domain-containing protein [Gimesia panareensis]|uniref:Transaldolase/EF-hand domain-containing protein n=1 Tax=Gimesia panareensis TaxID=2527978 RepID=A0A518FNL2_9PLAN|nr:EF-hand domain-containing protein [Gimesia panareensis]QDV17946.1 transaldolase/EF-hand domain-containing protein [Gimesia panareensis]